MHEALIRKTHKDRLVGHISRHATAIEARERPVMRSSSAPLKAQPAPATAPRKRGRPKKGAAAAKKKPRRLERQAGMTLAAMLADPPTACSTGIKRNAKGHNVSWIGSS